MTESEQTPLTPDVPAPPGTPELDLDIPVPETHKEKPGSQDVDDDAGEVEPPG
ncbi:hypothetical protein [Amycolatopsis sp. CA-128772]|uniref:hypothetical protein n=1 Tax=Amycolatopsis sp. CA-128772 TaxID=2073159 RepID=UPI0013049FC4|nr:hypothetical protein [Amycolatopsis sp. CA-128772]